mmetsp:Transcript_63552/g.143460  ORF Transcript_63552/g.143460 Transcript_63552/m.143460 type:complete len:255 (-) Transcript_63552:48-812(-)
MLPEGRRLAASSFEEDAAPSGHGSIWGSWYCTATHRWGFRCCRATSRQAAPCCPQLLAMASEPEDEARSTPKAAAAASTDWRPRQEFGSPETYVAHAMQHLALRWQAWLNDGTLAGAAQAMSSSAAGVLLSERVAKEAKGSVEYFCGRLYQQVLAKEIVSKLEEVCTCIHEREYTKANKLYVDLTIGSRKWLSDLPVFVHFDMKRQDTDVKWTPDSGKNPLEEAGLQEHILVLRRLLAVSQMVLPNDDPSRNCG